jgi:hypothetical protein
MRRTIVRSATSHRRVALESLENRTLFSTVVVTSGADEGAGTLRAALQKAGTDDSVTAIRVAPAVRTIRIDEALVFTGDQDLKIDGRATIQPVAGAEGDFDLLSVTGGGDLTLSRLTFRGGSDGVVVTLPAGATGTVDVTLRGVTIQDNDLFGLHVDDKTNDSAASVRLTVAQSAVLSNGKGASDKDGIRVDEGGAGNIDATILGSRLNRNGAEGVELDEEGAGSVNLRVTASTFNANGFLDPEDFDDGIDVDEADAGDVRVSITASQVNGNFDEGVDLNEGGDGSLRLTAVGLVANDNTDEGIALEETDAGDILASLTAVQARGNGADGFQAEEGGAGNLRASVFASAITNNDGFGIRAVQETPGSGILNLKANRLTGNADGPTEVEGTTIA